MGEMTDARRPIWEYLKSIGVDLTTDQHNEVKKLINAYSDSRNEMQKRQLDEMIAGAKKRSETKARINAEREAARARREAKAKASTQV